MPARPSDADSAPDTTASDAPQKRWLDVLSTEEIRALREVSNWRGAWIVAVNWSLIAGALAAVYASPLYLLPLTVPLALFVIGARQLGLAILMHEASHRTLFRTRWLNDFAGNWICAYPVYASLDLYRPYHLQHHAHTGTEKDPDLHLATGWPVTPASMRRKVMRDLFGVTGVKRIFAQTVFLFGAARGRSAELKNVAVLLGEDAGRKAAAMALVGPIATQLALVALFYAVGAVWLYAVWLGAWLTTYSLSMRIRAIAEHAMTGPAEDPLQNTRTVTASPLARLFIAPNRVYYHLEHHLLMTVPYDKLGKLHQLLRERGILEHACVEPNYRAVLRRVVDSSAANA